MDINGDHILSCTAETFPINSVEGQDDDAADAALTFLQHSIDEEDCEANDNEKEVESQSHDEEESQSHDEENGGGDVELDDDDNEQLDPSDEHIIKQLLLSIHGAVTRRLDAIDTKLEGVCINTKYLEDKLEQVFQHFNPSDTPFHVLPVVQQDIYPQSNLLSYVKVVEMTRPEEFDDCFESCYLGDEGDEQMRVRVPLSSDELTRFEEVCRTPEELALSLLDVLLDREALNDLSEHSQADVDNLLIHAIHLHLIHVFDISDDSWLRIQAELQSKCQTTNGTETCELADEANSFHGQQLTNSFHGQEFSSDYCPASLPEKGFQMDETDLDLDGVI